MEKTNTEHLKDLVGKVLIYDQKLKDEINEFIDAIDKESKNKNTIIDELKEEIENPDEENFIDADRLIDIDCGIGIIQYIEPDNLRLQLLMQEFKERQESVLQK